MATLPQTKNLNPWQHRPWSGSEKAVARKAFEKALRAELDEVSRKTKDKIAKIKEPSDLWQLEDYLTRRRHEIDRKYDFRYSVLCHVFGVLLHERRLTESDLQGLSEEKLETIRKVAGHLES